MPRPYPRRKLNPVVADAQTAFNEGDETFVAGLSLRPNKVATRKQTERGVSQLVAAVESVGWLHVDSRMTDPWTMEFMFTRR